MSQVDELTLLINSNVTGALAGMNTVERKAQTMGQKVGGVFTGLGAAATKAGKLMTLGLTLPIAAIGAGVIKLGMDAQSALATLEANAGMSADQLSDVKDGLFAIIGPLATDMPTAVDAAFTLFSAGITETDALLRDTEATLMAVNANLGESKELAGLAAVAFANFGQDATRTFDVLAYAASQAILGPDEMIKIFNRAAPTAAAAGVAFDDMAVAAIILANATGDSAKAGMFLDGMLKKIASAGPMATAALAEIGMDVPDFQEVFATMGLDAGMDYLDAEFAKAGMRSDEWTRQLFEGEAAIAAMALLGNDMGTSLAEGVEGADGELQSAFDVMMGTTQKKVDVILSTVKAKAAELGILILEAIGPYIDQITVKFEELMEAWDALSDEAKLNIVKIAAILATLGPALLIFGKLSTIFGAFIPIAIKVGAALLTMNPIVLAIAAVVGILVGLFFAMGGSLEDVKAIAMEVWRSIQQAVGDAAVVVEEVLGNLTTFWNEHWDEIKAVIDGAIAFLSEQFENLRNFIMPIVEKIATFIQDTFGEIVAWWNENWPAIQETAEIVMNAVQEVMDRVLPYIQRLWEIVFGIIGETVRTVTDGIMEVIRAVMHIIMGIIEVGMSIIRGDWSGAWEGIKKIIDGAWDLIMGIVRTALRLLWTAIKGAFNTITTGIGAAFTALRLLWQTAWNRLRDIVSSIWGGMADIIKGAFKGALNWVIDKINWAIDKLNGLIGGMNKVPGVNIPKVDNIPTLAGGGQLQVGGIVRVGDAGPEDIVLPRGAQVVPNSPSQGASGYGGGITINMNAPQNDPMGVAREVGWQLTKRGA